MKRYKVIYFKGDRTKPDYFIQLSKSGKRDGVTISFWSDGRKDWQLKFKNNSCNGLEKDLVWNNSKNRTFTNWKKQKTQGIKIKFNVI